MKYLNILNLTLAVVTYSLTSAQTVLVSTDFESGIPLSYTLIDNDGFTPDAVVSEFTSAWIPYTDPEDATNHVAASTSFFDPIGTADRWLITPALALGSYGNFISWKAKSHDASFPDDYLVMVSNTDMQLASFTDTIGYVMEEYAEWTTRSVDLSNEGYDNQTIYVAFINTTFDGFKLYMDSIEVWKDDPVGISENTLGNTNVYPNPFNSVINIQSEETIQQLNLLDLSGRMILSKEDSNSLNTETVPSGVYLLQIKTSSGLYSKRLLKN